MASARRGAVLLLTVATVGSELASHRSPVPPWVGSLAPRPQILRDREATAAISNATVIGSEPNATAVALDLQGELLRKLGMHLEVVSTASPAWAAAASRIALDVGPAAVATAAAAAGAAALQAPAQHQLHGDEGYVLDIRAAAATGLSVHIAGNTLVAVQHGAQTLVQLAVPAAHAGAGASVRCCSVVDWPDSPVRGVFMYGAQSNDLNVSYFKVMLDRMKRSKMNLDVFHNEFFWTLDSNRTCHACSPAADASRRANLVEIVQLHEARHIGLIPQLTPEGYFGAQAMPNMIEGVFARNVSFVVAADGRLVPAPDSPAVPACNHCPEPAGHQTPHSPAAAAPIACRPCAGALPLNGQFKTGGGSSLQAPIGWKYVNAAARFANWSSLKANCAPESKDGRPAVRCDGENRTDKWWSVQSDDFELDPGAYHVSAMVQTSSNCSRDGVDLTMQGPGQCASSHTLPVSSKEFGVLPPDWQNVSFTFVCTEQMSYEAGDPRVPNASLQPIRTRVHIRSTLLEAPCTWWVANVSVLRIGPSLVNVIRTDSTDVRVTDASTGRMFSLGTDYTVTSPARQNWAVAEARRVGMSISPNLITLFNEGAQYQIERTAGSGLAVGQHVNVSYDFLPGVVGEGGVAHHPVSMAEPMVFTTFCDAAHKTMRLLRPAGVFTSIDEIWGVNRDSRSLRLRLSNAALFARTMNKMQDCVAKIGVQIGLPAEAYTMIWDDMVGASPTAWRTSAESSLLTLLLRPYYPSPPSPLPPLRSLSPSGESAAHRRARE
eukprot:SAG22_NODE_1725_length_3714_cov_3.037621_2_plen_775_part_00